MAVSSPFFWLCRCFFFFFHVKHKGKATTLRQCTAQSIERSGSCNSSDSDGCCPFTPTPPPTQSGSWLPPVATDSRYIPAMNQPWVAAA